MKVASATAVLSAFAAATIAAGAAPNGGSLRAAPDQVPNGASIPADSEYGTRLLSKARRVQDNEEDVTWMVNYALRFDSCHEIAAVGGEEQRENMQGAGVQRLVKLRLCPKDSCSSHCSNGAEYVVEMREFLETYMQMKEEMEEGMCQMIEQQCEYKCQNNGNQNNNNNNNNNNNGQNNQDNNNNNGRALEDANNQNYYYNEEYCMKDCYENAGYGDCYEGDQNGNNQQQEFEVERFAECEPLNEGGGNNNNNNYNNGNYNNNAYQAAYVGAYCGNGGRSVNLAVFSDAACTIKSDNSLFAKYYYYSLPYTTTSIVGNECLSCDAAEYEWDENNNNGNNNYNYEVSQMCEEVHERAAKCEKNLKIDSSQSANYNNGYTRYYPHTESCQFIHSTLSGLESVTKSNGKSLTTARAFAWIFFITTLGCVGYILYLHSEKKKRSSVDLNGYGGGGGGEDWS